MTAVHPLPNILTTARLGAGVLMFAFLGAAVGIVPGLDLTQEQQSAAAVIAFWIFVIGAATDWVDGWAARKFDAHTEWGATLDPIADKILVTGAILGLLSLGPKPHVAIPAALILFREFAVSALRESTAAKGVRLKVTPLAKWKTTIQLVALGLQMGVYALALTYGLDPEQRDPLQATADAAMWLAAALTLWTGWDYLKGARAALPHER